MPAKYGFYGLFLVDATPPAGGGAILDLLLNYNFLS